MISKFLKIAGVKSEEEFYKKYPTEAAFFKAHPEAKKLRKSMQDGGQQQNLNQLTDFSNDPDNMIGSYISVADRPEPEPIDFRDLHAYMDYSISGMTPYDRMIEQYYEQNQPSDVEKIAEAIQPAEQETSAKKGKKIKKFQDAGVLSGVNSSMDPLLWSQAPSIDNQPVGTPMLNPNVNPPLMDASSNMQDITDTYSTPKSNLKDKAAGAYNKSGGLPGILGTAGKVVGALRQMKQEKNQMKQARRFEKFAGLTAQAANTRPERVKRKYVRPEDVTIQPNELYPTYGTGTEILSRDGSRIPKAQDGEEVTGSIYDGQGEIQNTYFPGTLYNDLAFEPLNDSNTVKRYRNGGVPQAGFGSFMAEQDPNSLGQVGGGFGSLIGGGGFSQTGGGDLGSIAGGTVGSIFGPAGKSIGSTVGGIAGGIYSGQLKKKEKRAREAGMASLNRAALQTGAQNIQNQYSAFMKDGGYLSNDWQPQLITQFGGLDAQEVYDYAHEGMDNLRTGGNITQNQISPFDQMAFGGQLKTHWGGYGEDISQNPYLPNSGKTIMFKGQSHEESDGKGRTGIGVSYGSTGTDSYTDYAEYGTDAATDKANVEVERNEPAIEMPDGNGGDSMVVYGNLKIPNMFLDEIGDPKAKGKKFKHYVRDLSKDENKQKKIAENSAKRLEKVDGLTPFSQLALSSEQANLIGANMKLKQIAEFKMNAAAVQNAINDTAELLNLDADALAKGKLAKSKEDGTAKNGITFAQTGTKKGKVTLPDPTSFKSKDEYLLALFDIAEKTKNKDAIKKFQEGMAQEHEPLVKTVMSKYDKTTLAKEKGLAKDDPKGNIDAKMGPRTRDLAASLRDFMSSKPAPAAQTTPATTTPATPTQTTPAQTTTSKKVEKKKISNFADTTQEGGLKLKDLITAYLSPYLMPTDTEELDPSQLSGERLALATNQLEPVQAQQMQALLDQSFDISLQDQLNEITASERAARMMAKGDPSAQSNISAQADMAKSRVLAEQFRLNQAKDVETYNENRNRLNRIQEMNIGLLDQQYVRQAQAKSNTKAVSQAALNSISDKIAKNKLENRTLGVYENLYNYRFDPRFRAINYNTAGPVIPQVGNAGRIPIYDKDNKIIGYQQVDSTTSSSSDTEDYVPEFTKMMQPRQPNLPQLIPASPNPFAGTDPFAKSTQKKGGKTSKNSDIIKAFKNL